MTAMSWEGEIRPGHRLDRYELLCPIAEGGMARVWIARQVGKYGFEKLVAIKTILPKFASDLRFQQMFLDEAKVASAIQHNNVARILDLGEEDDVLYIVMEWIDGEPLNRVQRSLARNRVAIPTGIVLRVMADVCAGLHAAHELRDKNDKLACVVHRDVSPQNILIGVDGVSKIIDFGIAKALDRAGGDTTAGTIKGKIHFMAPEQARGHDIDRRADVWAVGAILYNIFAGKPVYDDESHVSILHKLAAGVPPPPLPPKVPGSIANIILGALRHDRDQRWPTTEQMQLGLERAMIELNCHTTAATVAGFLGQHFGDRAVARRRTIDNATAALRELQDAVPGVAPPPILLEFPPPPASSSGLLDAAYHTPSKITGAKTPTPGRGAARGEPSAASLRSSSVDAAPQTKRGRRGLWLAGAAAMGALAFGSMVVPRHVRTGPTSATPRVAAPQSSAAAEPPAASSLAASPPATGAEPPAATAPPEPQPSTTARTAAAAPPRPTPAWRPSPAVRNASPPAPSSKPGAPARRIADDGF